MPNELQIINQPDSVPGSVVTGYQRQNTKLDAIPNGLDCSAPVVASATTVTLPVGGPVDVNGVLFSLISVAALTISLPDTDYYIYLAAGSDADHLTPTLTTDPGTFNASKNARYTAGGERILNWVVWRDASAAYVFKMVDVEQLVFFDQQVRKRDNITHVNGTFTGNVNVGNDLTVTDELTVGGAVLPSLSDSGVYTMSPGASMFLPRGMYNLYLEAATDAVMTVAVQYPPGVWRNIAIDGSPTSPDQNCCAVFSDGLNVKITVLGGAASSNCRWLKF